jgi:spore maturation protein CgeB
MAAIRYLVIGPEDPTWTTASRRRALARLGREVLSLSGYVPLSPQLKYLNWIEVLTATGPGVWRYNAAVVRAVRTLRPHVVWVESAALLWPKTLGQIKRDNVLLVHYTTDDVYNPGNSFRHNFQKAMSLYDLHVTTNIPNAVELAAVGVNVIRSQLGYDDELFYPRTLGPSELAEYGADVSFVGHWEPDTERAKAPKTRLAARDGVVPLEVYGKALCASKINLGFVSAKNRNQTAGRTFEIPACESFLLAPRTEEVANVFAEDQEAVFFGDAEELVEKALFYLGHHAERKRIAEAGHRRCLASGYSWLGRIRELIPKVEQRL